MSRYRKITTICCAAVLALGLAACGGGDDGIPVAERDAAVAAEQAKTEMLQKELNALRMQLGLEDDGNVGDSVADLQAEVMRLEGLVEAEEEKQAMADAAAMTAKLNKLATAIGAVDETALDNHIQSDTAKPKTATGADAPQAISGWNGSSYSQTTASKDTIMTVVYDNKEAPTSVAFAKRWATADGADAASRDGTYTFIAGDHAKYVAIEGMPSHPSHDGVMVGDTNGVRGTFNGVSGVFKSQTGAVEVELDKDSMVTWAGNLDFTPDSGTAMVMKDDDSYMSIGWWLTEMASGDLGVKVAAYMNKGVAGYANTNFSELKGKATFEGIAVGKYTYKTVNDISGGHFNADAMLVADFDDGSAPGTMTGTISGFMQDGEPVGNDWKVELGAAPTGDAGFNPKTGAAISATGITSEANNAMGTFGNQKTLGTWNASFEGAGRNDGMPGGVIGQFHIGETSHPINMVGAFATSNMEMDQPKN